MVEKIWAISSKRREEVIDITEPVRDFVRSSQVKEGICLVYVPHATAAVIVNENMDPQIKEDFLEALSLLIPKGKWRHDRVDGNGDAHIKAALVGPSQTIPVKDGELRLGKWQNIMVADFDGPRERKVILKILPG